MRKVREHHGKVPEVNFLYGLLPLSPGNKGILELVPFGRKTVSHEASFQLSLQRGAGQESHGEGDGRVPGSEHACAPTRSTTYRKKLKGDFASDCHPLALCPLQAISLAGLQWARA